MLAAMNRTIAMLLCGLPLAVSAQQIYKWVDASGQVHFSQNPPKDGSYQNVTPQQPVSGTTTGGGSQPVHSSWPSSSSSGGSSAALQSKTDNEERCAKARERISFLQEKTAHRLFITGDDGQPARMTDEQFNEQLKDAQDAADKYCNG